MSENTGINIDELVMAAAESSDPRVIIELGKALELFKKLDDEPIAEQIEFLFESWGRGVAESRERCLFCVEAARRGIRDTPTARAALTQAFQGLLPAQYAKRNVHTNTGVRDQAVPISDALWRFDNLTALADRSLALQRQSCQWRRVREIDTFSFNVVLENVGGGFAESVGLTPFLCNYLVFKPNEELIAIVKDLRRAVGSPATKWRRAMADAANLPMSPEVLRKLAERMTVPEILNPTAFETWWNAAEGKAVADGVGRPPEAARSLNELHLLLKEALKTKAEADVGAAERFAELFGKLKPASTPADRQRLVECLAMTAEYLGGAAPLGVALAPLAGCYPFFSAEPGVAEKLESFSDLSSIPAKQVAPFALCLQAVFGDSHLRLIWASLPTRCLGAFAEILGIDAIPSLLAELSPTPPDIYLWIWKTRRKLPASLIKSVNLQSVLDSISNRLLPDDRQSARRELAGVLINDDNFHKHIVATCPDVDTLIFELRAATGIEESERQALIVKLTRHSPGLKARLSEGGGKLLAIDKRATQQAAVEEHDSGELTTSVVSYNRRVAQFKDIIERQIPENVAAIGHARSYGDLRENSEYKAAKEEEGRLARRRTELEAEIAAARPIEMAGIKVGEYSTIGSTITMRDSAGAEHVYHLLGAWDAQPEKHRISYKTPFGAALLHRKVGDPVELPGHAPAEIIAVSTLSADIAAALDRDD